MKTALVFAPWLLAFCALAQPSPPTVVERGPHHRTWAGVQEVSTPQGPRFRTNNVIVELQSGLHRWYAVARSWVEASPRLELHQDGAIVRGLQYAVIFAPNLATPGAMDFQLPDGQRLTGHLLGLAYTEGAHSVLIAEVTDCSAEITGPEQNILTYRNAFTDYAIDVQYVVTRERFSQNLILLERLKSPLGYGLSENAHLEVLTEWTAAPPITKETRLIEPVHDGQRALTDERISLGAMQFSGSPRRLSWTSTAMTRRRWSRTSSTCWVGTTRPSMPTEPPARHFTTLKGKW
jgi:hypothetical protein